LILHTTHLATRVEEYLQSVDATKKDWNCIGDRRDEDIRECATIAARMFDHIIIRQENI
jgi:cyanophycin synthetase